MTPDAELGSDPWRTLELPGTLRTQAASLSIRRLHQAATEGGPIEAPDDDVSAELAGLPSIALADEGEPDPDAEFVIDGRIGEGGMGVVDRAWQRSLARDVAVKRVLRGGMSSSAVRDLLSEARITGVLEHPNIIPVHAIGRDAEGNAAFVMKRVEGVRHTDLVYGPSHPMWETLPPDRLRWHLETLMQVCHAIEFAHSRGVLHLDLKLDNVMIGVFGEIYVLDWGIALSLPEGCDVAERTTIVGTPASMAPEVVKGGPLDRRTDVYLLGAMLHEVLTASPRHPGGTFEAVLESIVRSDPFDYGDLPEELAAIANRATARDPDERFAGVRALRQAIHQFLEHRESATLCEEGDRLWAAAGEETASRVELGTALFAYRQALARWDGNTRAEAGRRAVLRELFLLDVDEGHRAAAAARLEEIPEPEPDLVAQLEALDARIAADRSRVQRLERIAEDYDPSHRGHERRRGLVIITAVVVLGIVPPLVAKWLGLRPSHRDLFLMACGPAVLGPIVMLSTRLGGSNRISRAVGWSFTAAFWAAATGRGAAWWLDASIPRMHAFELLGFATACVLVALTVHRSFFIYAPVIYLAFFAALAFPLWAMEIASAVMLVCFGLAVRRWTDPRGPTPPLAPRMSGDADVPS